MSIFDPTSGWNPLPWLQEKTLRALEEAARLVDLANEKDTAPWYAKELKRRAGALIGRLAPVVSLLHQVEDAASHDEWGAIRERGTFALAAWCKKHDVQDPAQRAFDLLAKEHEDGEAEAKAERHAPERDDLDDLRTLDLRCTIYGSLTRRLLHEDLPEAARRMLLWALSHLTLGHGPDVVSLSRRFLPTDIDLDPETTAAAYRCLIERGLIERVDDDADGDALRLRLIAEGFNESKQPLPPGEVTFGFPGARVGGKPTLGNELRVALPAAYLKTLLRWRFGDDDRKALGAALQAHLGPQRAFVEAIAIDDGGEPAVLVRLRYSWDEDDRDMTRALHEATLAWVRARLAPSKGTSPTQ